jgi:predicted DNA-binding protein
MRPRQRWRAADAEHPSNGLASDFMFVVASAAAVAAITAGATLLAALGAVFVTIHTTKERLRAERERQLRDLAAESQRQAAALAHDRALADLDDLRRLLDDATLGLERARRLREMLENSWQPSGRTVPEEIAVTIDEQVDALFALNARLMVRLGTEDPIAIEFEEASDSFFLIRGALLVGADTQRTPAEMHEDIRDLGMKFSAAVSGFLRAALERSGTVPSPGVLGQ